MDRFGTPSDPLVAILAGGRSTRMGRDKAVLDIDGISMIQRVATAVRLADLQAVVVGRKASSGSVKSLLHIPDLASGGGPAAGIRAALTHAGNRWVLGLPCDLPDLSAPFLRWLCGLVPDPREHDAIAIRHGSHLHPLPGLYHPTCLPRLEHGKGLYTLFRDDPRAVHDLPEQFASDLFDLDTPDDLDSRRRLRKG